MDFKEAYSRHESLLAQRSETDATISILLEIQRWCQLLDQIDESLQNNRLDNVHNDLLAANGILSNLKQQSREVDILSKMVGQSNKITLSVRDAFTKLWDSMIIIETIESETTLKVSEDSKGALSPELWLIADWNTVILHLSEYDMLEQKVSNFVNSLQKTFINPLMEGFRLISDERTLLIRAERLSSSPETILAHLSILIVFLSKALPQLVFNLLIQNLVPIITTRLTGFITSFIPTSIDDLSAFDKLIASLSHFNQTLADLEWTSSTALTEWISNAPKVWFASRQAAFLKNARTWIVQESTNQRNVVIHSGVDIMKDPQLVYNDRIENKMTETPLMNLTLEKQDDVDDETDGWKFDEKDVDTDETPQISQDLELDPWKWEEESDILSSQNGETGSFPYSISSIPDGLMSIVEQILSEGLQLQSARFRFNQSILSLVILNILLLGMQGTIH
jgi:protein transport protein DSL1/ZW10